MTRPLSDVSILFAIPATREEFDLAVNGELYEDYAREFRRLDPSTYWETNYAAVVDAIEELTQSARQLNANVTYRATLADLQRESETATVIVLLAHFRGWVIVADDFGTSADAALARAGAGDPILSMGDRAPRNVADLVSDLNDAISRNALSEQIDEGVWKMRMSEIMRWSIQRDLIDSRLSAILKPGNRVELADGCHTPGRVVEAIAPTFRGELDLSICDSEVLATVVSRRRRESIRTGYFASEIVPIPHLMAIRAALMRVAETGESYLDTRRNIYYALKNEQR